MRVLSLGQSNPITPNTPSVNLNLEFPIWPIFGFQRLSAPTFTYASPYFGIKIWIQRVPRKSERLTGWRAPERGRCVLPAASKRVRGAPDPSAPSPCRRSSPPGAGSGTHDDASSPLQPTTTTTTCSCGCLALPPSIRERCWLVHVRYSG